MKVVRWECPGYNETQPHICRDFQVTRQQLIQSRDSALPGPLCCTAARLACAAPVAVPQCGK